jgi:predicted metal-dependent enzyme (double-stranded beta helix superfamily)
MAHRLKFDREQFAADCAAAVREPDGMLAVREVLTRAVSDPGAVLAGLGEPTQAAMDVLLRSDTLTIFAATWTPRMSLRPHDHNMWALIGIYTGREDNILWRETERGLEARGANCLFEGDVAMLGKDAVHSVTNPLTRFTGGLHIYGGDFFATERHQWDPETLEQQPSNGEVIRAIFAEENARYQAGLPTA